SDFWVSQQKHWCKYCKKYVYNNKPTIQKHESGSVHKDNVERFLSDDAESVRRELQRIEKAAHKSMAGIGGSDSQPADHTTSYPPPPPPPSLPVRTPRYHAAPIPTLESLATPSPTAHLQGRDEWAIPQEKETAAVGQWQSVDTHPKQKKYNGKKAAPQQQEHTHDQAPEFQDDDEVADEDLNEFKFKEKEYPLDDDNLVGLSPAKDSADTEEGATSSGLFKKRKLGGQKGNLATKKRMIRKKGD
ncbi:hypothetical protein BCR42DRAFT_404861, partial [Absidia repens]